jgi:hypothetical protein
MQNIMPAVRRGIEATPAPDGEEREPMDGFLAHGGTVNMF